jgi:hypothetical protein
VLTDPNWGSLLRDALATVGEVHLKADARDAAKLRGEIVKLLGSPVEAEYLRLYPCLDGLRRQAGSIVAEISVRERM